MVDEIYVFKNGQKHGPFTFAKIQNYVSNGKLEVRDLVWYQGLKDWTPVGQVKELLPNPPPLKTSAPVPPAARPAMSNVAPEVVAGKYCHACGATIDNRAEICPKCGVRQPGQFSDRPADAPNKVIACLLALFLGLVGAHHFYLGRPALGVLYLVLNLLFFWTIIVPVIFEIICLIEGLLYLTYSDSAFAIRYRRS